MAEIKNLPGAEAEARLAAQLVPRDERASGIRGDENYIEATGELERLVSRGADRPRPAKQGVATSGSAARLKVISCRLARGMKASDGGRRETPPSLSGRRFTLPVMPNSREHQVHDVVPLR